MRIAVVDIQGFYIQKELHPKEITIQINYSANHYLIKPSLPFQGLSLGDKKTVLYAEKYHGIHYSSGNVNYSEINNILKKHLANIDIVYLRGNQKVDFLNRKCEELNLICDVLDISKFDSDCRFENAPPPKIEVTKKPICLNHRIPARCTSINCQTISRWIYSLLPLEPHLPR